MMAAGGVNQQQQPHHHAQQAQHHTAYSGPNSIDSTSMGQQQQVQPGMQRNLSNASAVPAQTSGPVPPCGPGSVPDAFGSNAGGYQASPVAANQQPMSNQGYGLAPPPPAMPPGAESQGGRQPMVPQQQQGPQQQQYYSPMPPASYEVSFERERE